MAVCHRVHHRSGGDGSGNPRQPAARSDVRQLALCLGRVDRGDPCGHEQRVCDGGMARRPPAGRGCRGRASAGLGWLDVPVGLGGAAGHVQSLRVDSGPSLGALRGRQPAAGAPGIRTERRASRAAPPLDRRYGTSGKAHGRHDRGLNSREPRRDLGNGLLSVDLAGQHEAGGRAGRDPGPARVGVVVACSGGPSADGGPRGRRPGPDGLAGPASGSRAARADLSRGQPVPTNPRSG